MPEAEHRQAFEEWKANYKEE